MLILKSIIFILLTQIIFAMDNNAYTTLSTEEFQEAIKSPDVITVDVRQPEEYASGHIENAINIDVKEEDFINKAESRLPKDKVIAVYCRSGKRSAMAAEMLTEKGYKVLNLEDGIEDWKSRNLPIEI